MQALQDQREENELMFGSIEKRWSVIDEAVRIEGKERGEETQMLYGTLGNMSLTAQKLESSKAQVLAGQLSQLQSGAEEVKQEIGKMFEKEADFRNTHLQQKNTFLQTYSETSNSFNNQMQEYCQAKLTDVSNRLITIDSAARQETETAVQQIRESTTVFKEMLKGERKRVEDMLEKTSEEACRQVEELRSKVRESTRKREDSEAKLQLMVSDLASELTKLQQIQEMEGEISYDCLLKLIEDACAKIHQAQLGKH